MKKIIFSLLVLGLGFSANAQIQRGNLITERTKLGIKAGLSASNQIQEDYGIGIAAFDTKAGITAGVEAEVPVRNGWYIQPEVNYANMGTRQYTTYTNSNTGQQEEGTVRYANNYIQVPVLIKYRPLFTGFGVFAGPQLGIHVQAKENPIDYKPVITTDDYAHFEFAGVAGLEYYIPTPDDRMPSFGLSARYMYGFTNIYPNNSQAASNGFLRNSGFQLTAGIRF